MDLLKAEIERKKKKIEKSQVVTGERKYFKRSELSAKQAEEYMLKHKRRKIEDEQGNAGSLHQSTSGQGDESVQPQDNDVVEAGKDKGILSRKEVIKRLRERTEPILLFGESEYEAYQRLKKLEILTPEVNKGLNNDFKAAMDEVDQKYLNELSMGMTNSARNAYNVIFKPSGMKEEDMLPLSEELGSESIRDQEIILKFTRYVLEKWGEDINSRDEEVKKSRNGKLETATYTQTVGYMSPLLISLEKKQIDEAIRVCLGDIVKQLLIRDYIKANEHYMEMAIGNAPWPIGVTMVGIHARTGREKINDKNVAHVLNDETQRKYIQAFKRLMTRCQKYFPADPSKMVDYQKPKD